jgi:hypothetical protein
MNFLAELSHSLCGTLLWKGCFKLYKVEYYDDW